MKKFALLLAAALAAFLVLKDKPMPVVDIISPATKFKIEPPEILIEELCAEASNFLYSTKIINFPVQELVIDAREQMPLIKKYLTEQFAKANGSQIDFIGMMHTLGISKDETDAYLKRMHRGIERKIDSDYDTLITESSAINHSFNLDDYKFEQFEETRLAGIPMTMEQLELELLPILREADASLKFLDAGSKVKVIGGEWPEIHRLNEMIQLASQSNDQIRKDFYGDAEVGASTKSKQPIDPILRLRSAIALARALPEPEGKKVVLYGFQHIKDFVEFSARLGVKAKFMQPEGIENSQK